MAVVTSGRSPPGLPYLRLGQGPPLMTMLGGSPAAAGIALGFLLGG